MSTGAIMPKIIQRPAGIHLQKRPAEESRNIDGKEMKVIPKTNMPPAPVLNNNESCSKDTGKEEKKDGPATVMNANTSMATSPGGTAPVISAAAAGEWNPLEEVDSALLTALCDSKERKALVRLESILVQFMKDTSVASIDIGGAFNSIVVGLRQQQSAENENCPAEGGISNEEDATTFVPSQSQGLQDLLNQYQRGIRQTSFQRLILHRLADRFNILREQINNVNPAAATITAAERNTSERGLLDVGGNNNNNWSSQQQQNSFPLGLIRLIKNEESCIPDHLLINLDLSILVNYKNPRARNFVPNNNNNAEEGMRTLSDNMNATSLDTSVGVPKISKKKMVIMKRNSSSNTSGSGEGLSNGKREGRARRKKFEDREKAYEEARARIFGKEEKKDAEGLPDDLPSAVQENLSPLNSCHSSFSAEEVIEAPFTSTESVNVNNGSQIVPSQLLTGTSPKIRSASPSPEPASVAVPEGSPVETEDEERQNQPKTKAVYRNRQQEENDPDFRRRSAYVPAMGGTPSGHMTSGVPFNMANPYANPYSAVPGQQPRFYPHPGQVTPQDDPQMLQHYPGYQPRVFYPAQPQQMQSQTQPRSIEQQQVQPSVLRKTNESSRVAHRPENSIPPVIDTFKQPKKPSWGPSARIEIKTSEPNAAPVRKTPPAKITTTPPATSETRGNKTILYKDEDFPALG